MRSLQGKLDEVSDGIGSDYEWDDLGVLFPQVLAARAVDRTRSTTRSRSG